MMSSISFPRLIFTLSVLLTVDIQAKDEKPVVGMHVMYQDLAWSPDKSTIYFSAMKVKKDFSDFIFTKWSIYKADLKTGKLTTFADSALWVSVSNDNQIAYSQIVGKDQDIWIVDSGKTRSLTTGAMTDYAPSWSPNSKQIAFNRRDDKNHPQIFTINVDGTNLTQLTNGTDSTWSANPVWSPDGKHIVYYREKGDRRDQVFVMNPDGTGKTNITRDTLNNFYPAWIDSTRILYARSYPNDQKDMYLIKSDGTGKAPLFTLQSFFARYSNDGSLIAYIDNQQQAIHIITASGMEVTKISLPL